MDLYWSKPIETSLFGSLFFSGVLVGMIILAFTSKYGRRINLIVSSIITLIEIYLLIFINNLYSRYIGMFVLGWCLIRNIQSYIIATELSPNRIQIVVTTFVLGIDVLTLPAWSLFYKFISNDWKYITYFIIPMSTLITIASLFVPESPLFLYEKGEYEKARKLIWNISKINNLSLQYEFWNFDKEDKLNSKKFY